METFNRKLNMIKITGLSILLILVKHGHVNSTTPPTAASKPSTEMTTTLNLTEAAKKSLISSSGITTNGSPITSLLSSTSSNSTVKTTPTTSTLPTTIKAPEVCYQATCDKATCKVSDNIVSFPKNVKNCTRNNGSCYVKKTVDSAKPNTVMYTAGCVASCTDDAKNTTGNVTDTFSCCKSNLCNNNLNSVGQLRYHLLLSLHCIVMSFLIGW